MVWRWQLAPGQTPVCLRLQQALRVSSLLAQCLVNRGVREPAEAEAFLEPRLRQLRDPAELPDMAKAVDRVLQAVHRGESVVIVGDYDVDGVTASCLLLEALRALGGVVQAYLPHRFEEGYGLSDEAVARCLERYPSTLLIAVDCGSTANATIARLAEQGLDVIVLDHHQVSSPPPPALALVNPRARVLAPGEEPCELASVGLAFKLVHALVKRGRQDGWAPALALDIRIYLDLVALGTIADLVPLTGENRILVAAGLERMGAGQRVGLKALRSVAGKAEGKPSVQEVAFQLGPRLNAAGRLEHASLALDLLCASEPACAESVACELDSHNRRRQEIEQGMVEQVLGTVRSRFDAARDFVIVEGALLWHIGVVGIVASRVVREFYRPTLIVGGEGESWRGSGRSVEGFDLAAALRECSDLLVRHGGHAMAAGVTLHPDNLDALRRRLNELARTRLTPEQLRPVLRLDAEVCLAAMTVGSLAELERLQPLGQHNPAVQLVSRRLRLSRPPRRMGKEGKHAKLWVTDGVTECEAVWWNAPAGEIPRAFDLAFAPQLNVFEGRETVQLRVLDLQAGG